MQLRMPSFLLIKAPLISVCIFLAWLCARLVLGPEKFEGGPVAEVAFWLVALPTAVAALAQVVAIPWGITAIIRRPELQSWRPACTLLFGATFLAVVVWLIARSIA
jgi:hypothetical protein